MIHSSKYIYIKLLYPNLIICMLICAQPNRRHQQILHCSWNIYWVPDTAVADWPMTDWTNVSVPSNG